MDDDAATLRARAEHLRRLAARLDASSLRALRAAGGDTTWRGPAADAFVDDCAWATAQLEAAVDELWHGARLLDQRADVAAGANGPGWPR